MTRADGRGGDAGQKRLALPDPRPSGFTARIPPSLRRFQSFVLDLFRIRAYLRLSRCAPNGRWRFVYGSWTARTWVLEHRILT